MCSLRYLRKDREPWYKFIVHEIKYQHLHFDILWNETEHLGSILIIYFGISVFRN